MTGDLDMGNHLIKGVSELVMNGSISMNNQRINSLPKPTGDQQPVTLIYGDDNYLRRNGSKTMFGDLSMNTHIIYGPSEIRMNGSIYMNDNTIYGIPNATGDQQPVTRIYADDNYLKLDGSNAMTGNMDMGGNAIINIKPFVEDDSIQPAQNNEVINFGYFHTERGELKRLINEVAYDALNRKNPDPMESNIDMANHSIINLKDPQPSDASHAASVNFVNNAVNDTVNGNNFIIVGVINDKIKESEERSVEAVQQENVFENVMVDDLFILDDDDIHKVAVVNKDFHKVNQQTYQFKIDYDSNLGYFSTRLGVNVV